MYITYDEYKDLGGGLDETAFNVFAYEAEMKINAETHGRITTVTEPIKRCVVRLTDIMAQADISSAKTTSWSNEGVSKSFKDVSSYEYNAKINSIIRDYLANEVDENGVPLLHLGVC